MSVSYELLTTETLLQGKGTLDIVSVKTKHNDGREHVTEEPIWSDGDSIAVLPVDYDAGTVLLVRQLRPAVFLRNKSIIVEACAGGIEAEDASIESACHREAMEEMGVILSELTSVSTLFVCPARLTEKAHLFLARYVAGQYRPDLRQQDEDEDIEVVEVTIAELKDWYQRGAIQCPRLMILAQSLLLRL
jgi:nudix-type nucleoside diphosphatase (YffH/AdpP family)